MKSNYEKNHEGFVKDETQTEEKVVRKPKKYIITVNNLALREGPGKDFEKIGIAEAGHTLIDEIKDGFGHLADDSGWVCMDYTRKAD